MLNNDTTVTICLRVMGIVKCFDILRYSHSQTFFLIDMTENHLETMRVEHVNIKCTYQYLREVLWR